MSWLRLLLLAASTVMAVQAVRAEEPQGCDKFRWPVERERAALSAETVAPAVPGEVRTESASAFALTLVPVDAAALPRAPERSPSPEHSRAP